MAAGLAVAFRRRRACRPALALVYTYSTRYGPNGQISSMNLGTVAGFGKLFSSGGQLLMGFANEVAFNFLNKNPAQPTVISALPISFVQPLLRGGGRAVILEPLTQAERNLLYAVRTFTLFRQQFFIVTLTGGSIQNFGNNFHLVGLLGSRATPTRSSASSWSFLTWLKWKSTGGTLFFWKVSLNYIKS